MLSLAEEQRLREREQSILLSQPKEALVDMILKERGRYFLLLNEKNSLKSKIEEISYQLKLLSQ